MNYSRLKGKAKEKKISIKRLVEENTDMSESGFYQAIKNRSLTIRVLEDIARVLEMPVGYFFDDYCENQVLSKESDVRKLQEEIINLQRQLIQEKERNIRLMEKQAGGVGLHL